MPLSEKLDTLTLSFNFITSLENLDHAPNLSVLDLHNNKLRDVPDVIVSLSNLKTLTLSNNDLSDLNPRMGLMPNLVRIQIEGNPLKRIKAAMRNANAVELKKYLKLRMDESDIHNAEVQMDAKKGMPGAKRALEEQERQGRDVEMRDEESKAP